MRAPTFDIMAFPLVAYLGPLIVGKCVPKTLPQGLKVHVGNILTQLDVSQGRYSVLSSKIVDRMNNYALVSNSFDILASIS